MSIIKEVVIDTSKGLDVAALKVQEVVVSAAAPSPEIKPISKPKPTSTAEEQEHAKKSNQGL